MESSRWCFSVFPHKLQLPLFLVRLGWSEPRTHFRVRKNHSKEHLPETLLLISKHLCAHKNTDTLTFLSFWITKNINICFSSGDTVSSSAVSWEGRLARSSRSRVITLFWFFTWSPEHCMWDKAQASSSFLLIRVTSHLVYPLSVSEIKEGLHLPLLSLPDMFFILFTNFSSVYCFVGHFVYTEHFSTVIQ